MAFAPGDVVALKSGGLPMTVVAVGDEDIDCLWAGDDGELFRQSIPMIALTNVEMPESAEAEEDAEEEDDEDEDEEEDEEDEGEKRRAKKR